MCFFMHIKPCFNICQSVTVEADMAKKGLYRSCLKVILNFITCSWKKLVAEFFFVFYGGKTKMTLASKICSKQ